MFKSPSWRSLFSSWNLPTFSCKFWTCFSRSLFTPDKFSSFIWVTLLTRSSTSIVSTTCCQSLVNCSICLSLTLKSNCRSLTFLLNSSWKRSTSLFSSLWKAEVLASKFSCMSHILSERWFSTSVTLLEKDSNSVK